MGIKKLFSGIQKSDDFCVQTNLLENRYVTDGIIWTVDETIFNKDTKLFLVVSLNTRAILGYIQAKNCRNDDLIIELYSKILDDYEFSKTPYLVHSDMEETYHSEKVREFLASRNICVSVTEGKKNQNQVSESVNARIKALVAQELLQDTNSKRYQVFRDTLPSKLKAIKVSRAHEDSEYRKMLFRSNLFKLQRQHVIQKAILRYNKGQFSEGITRQEAHYYDSFVEGRTINNTRLVDGKSIIAAMVKKDNAASIKQVKQQITDIIAQNISTEEKVTKIAEVMVERQDSSTELMKEGFVGLAIQNEEKAAELKEELALLQMQLKKVTDELEKKNRLEQLAQERKEKRRNRRILPKRDPMTQEIYDFLIERTYDIGVNNNLYNAARLRLALVLLAITGVRISELLPLKCDQLQLLFDKGWIRIDRVKRGPSSHKAFLTREGSRLLRKRTSDFETVKYFKENDSYIFTQQCCADPLNRDSFQRMINLFLKESVDTLPNQPNIRSHSFRRGFITKLWRDTGDIEFVRQAIGHAKIDTTSKYIQDLTADERQKRMIDIQSTDDLFYDE